MRILALSWVALSACVGQPTGAVSVYCQWSDQFGAPVPAVHLNRGSSVGLTAICEKDDGFTGASLSARSSLHNNGITVTYSAPDLPSLPATTTATIAAAATSTSDAFELCATPTGLTKGHAPVEVCQEVMVLLQ